MSDYVSDARSDATEFIDNYKTEILDTLVEGDKASTDLLNDYGSGDSFIHESYTDRWYSLREAVDVLEDLDEYEETDSGLWEGQDMKEALSTCAAYTYSNAVQHFIVEAIEEINDRAESVLDDFNSYEAPDDDNEETEELTDEERQADLRVQLEEIIDAVMSDYKE